MSETESAPTSDAIQILIDDHREVELLFSQISAVGSPGSGKGDAIRSVSRELSAHAAVEEQVLYPAVRKELPDGDQLADHGLEEHQEVKETLASLEEADPESPETDALLEQLMTSFREHVQDEETDVFPKLRAAMSPEALEKMGKAIETAKKAAPTHPHPNAPNTPPGNIVGGAAAAVVDKVRDALRRD